MRTIKFRGKRVDNGEWVYGHYYTNNLGSQHMIKVSDDNFSGNLEVHPETVGQFTGLHDKDGNEIYEGDIVNYTNPYNHNNYTHKVEWDEKWACFALFNNMSVYAQESDWVKIREISIKGNIHDNPELIQEDGK